MIGSAVRKIFGSSNDRFVKSQRAIVKKINALEGEISALDDNALKAKTAEFKDRLNKGETEDQLLVEAFAVVREASKRTLGLRQHDVQMIGGIVLHKGMIAEMRTGEGKTLVAVAPIYLNALSGKGTHVVTVNDYLAQRDATWMGEIYNFLGLSVGVILPSISDDERQAAYACDVTYATNNELGFDYLRDNLKFELKTMVQREHHFAIVDEVDSILIDEARTPLIISGPAEDVSQVYRAIDTLLPQLADEHYEKDEKKKTITLTEAGQVHVETLLKEAGILQSGALYDVENVMFVHHINQALKAHKMFTKDKDYIVKDGQVVIIDEFTGRMMQGRRYSDGLHQALEAKEGVSIQMENQTLASVTFQNYFRMYGKLSGMTGTAMTEAAEFEEIYNLRVVDIPTHKPVARQDHHDEIYRTSAERDEAVIKQIQGCVAKKQPVLVGTVSIEKSEDFSKQLQKLGIAHNVLNARQHGTEALTIAEGGLPGAVTIATNMAGRGTDIKVGGNEELALAKALQGITDQGKIDEITTKITHEIAKNKEVGLNAGGLYVIGTERHESRRIDNQLRGRSGRQGDPGESKFFISLEDDLMRIFGSERMDSMLGKLGIERGEAIIHPWISKALEKAQKKVEEHHFEIRKQLLKYDNVMNDQRQAIFSQRRDLMEQDDISEVIKDMYAETVEDAVLTAMPPESLPDTWDTDSLRMDCIRLLGVDCPINDWVSEEGVDPDTINERLQKIATDVQTFRESEFGSDAMRDIEKNVMLQVLDHLWKEHLLSLDHLRQGIGLRAYAQRDPLNEYKREAFSLFESLLSNLRWTTVQYLSHIQMADPNKRSNYTPNRNAKCSCGSGQKYKHCCGAL